MTAPLRIMLIEGSGRGFLSHYAHALALGLHEAGHSVRLVTGCRDELSGWPVPFGKGACLHKGVAGWLCLAREVQAFRPDVVHFQWMNDPFVGRLFIAWLHARGIGVAYTPHNLLPHRGRWLSMPVFGYFYRCIDRIVARDPHMVWAGEELLGVAPRRMVQLPGSPNLIAHPSAPRNDPPELAAKAPDEVRVLFFGHGCRRKGLATLLDALAGFDWPRTVHVVLAGDGVLRGADPDTLAAAGRRVRLTILDRYVEPDAVSALFGTADLLVMPYRKLCRSPIVDLAAAFGLPVLRSDRVEGTRFRDGTHGLTVPHGDARALRETLARLAGGPARIAALKAALGREEPVTAATARLAAGHARMYADLMAERRSVRPAPRIVDAGVPRPSSSSLG